MKTRLLNFTQNFFRLALALVLSLSPIALLAANVPSQPAPKPDEFLKTWLILKPIPVASDNKNEPNNAAQQQAFKADPIFGPEGAAGLVPQPGLKQKVGTHEFEWTLVESKKDVVDLGASDEFSIAYAWTEFEAPKTGKAFLGIGSAECVKVWLNGKLVHEHWISRPVVPDDDVVSVELAPGKNRFLLKVQNRKSGWGFQCRLMSPEAQGQRLVGAVWMGGDVSKVQELLDAGLDVNGHGKAGLTAIQAARMRGETEVVEFLKSRGANPNAETVSPEKLTDVLFSRLISNNGPGAAVLVAQDGKILFEKGYGLADVAGNIPITPETKFRIGSITKQFTAASILKLQEQGKLSVQDKLSKYYPDFPRGGEVTLQHLLTHTSGIHSYTSKPDFMEKVTSPTTTEAIIESFKNDPYDFDPGKKWLYDNSGYMLLGSIITKVSGDDYATYLQKTFFTPLGMTNTGVHHAGASLAHEARGYEFSGESSTNAVNWDMSWAGGAGALYSTVGDLYRWNEGIFHGKILSDASLQAAFAPVKTEENKADTRDSGYGYGWFASNMRGTREISHGGGLNGFSSFLMRLPKENFTVVILANAMPEMRGVDPGQLAHVLAEFYLGEKLAPRTTMKVDASVSPSSYDTLTGRYDYGFGVLTVEHEGKHLYAQLTGQARYEIFPSSETNFFWKAVEAQVTFVKDSSGKVTKAIHHQNGQTINAPRLDDGKVAKNATANFDAIVGRYDYGGGIMEVTREGSHLYAQLTGQPRYEIFPKTESDFFWKVVDAQVTFVKDSNGKITKAIHHQNGGTINAPRVADVKTAKVDPAQYDALLGRYDYGGQAIMTVTRTGNQLYAQLTGQQKFEIFPESPTNFYWKAVAAKVTFVKNAQGKVTKAIHEQGGRKFDAPKLD